jgi:hypothetical protein
MLAAEKGDFGLLRAELAAKNIPGAAEFLNLGEKAYTAEAARRADVKARETAAVLEVVGGEKNWNAIRAWASKNADPAEKDAVNKGLAVGGIVAKATAQYLAGLYSKAAGTTVEPAEVLGSASATKAPASGALAPAEYKEAVRELQSRVGTDLDNHPEYKALVARRHAWR